MLYLNVLFLLSGLAALHVRAQDEKGESVRSEIKDFPLVITELALGPRRNTVHPAPDLASIYAADKWKTKQTFDEILSLGEPALIAMLPKQVGSCFVRCPACGLNDKGSEWTWTIANPDQVTCNYCKTTFPNDKYPANEVLEVTAPSGRTMRYPYYRNADGVRMFFHAEVDYQKLRYFEDAVYVLALHYHETKDEKYARPATVILCSLARAFPDFVYKSQGFGLKEPGFINGEPTPAAAAGTLSATRWSWWTYMDVPRNPMLAYDLLYNSTSFQEYVRAENIAPDTIIGQDFFVTAAVASLRMKELFHNMSPGYWQDLIVCARVTGYPVFEDIALSRMRKMLTTSFFSDGLWKEPAGGYLQQMVGLMSTFMRVSGPETADLIRPYHEQCTKALEQNTYPDGFGIPMADSWMLSTVLAKGKEQASYLQGGMGHGMLATPPNGNQMQLHLFWTPDVWYHPHRDTLGITLWANRKEMLSDIGYTWTRYHRFTHTSAAHNLVVVDGKNLTVRNGDYLRRGDLRYMDRDNPLCQIIDADGSPANNGNLYRRTLFLINIDADNYYLADFFECAGGARYDYFLHGNCAKEDALTVADADGKALEVPAAPLYPDDVAGEWTEPDGPADQNYLKPYNAYGYFRDTGAIAMGEVAGLGLTARLTAGAAGGLAVHVPAGHGVSRIFTGRSSAIRQCGQDDNTKLDKVFRRFIMLRKERDAPGSAYFQTVLEPFTTTPQVTRAVIPGPGILMLSHSKGTDILFTRKANDTPTLTVGDMKIQAYGDYGYISLAGGSIRRYHVVGGGFTVNGTSYATGPAASCRVTGTEGEHTILADPAGLSGMAAALSPFVLTRFEEDARYKIKDVCYGFFTNAFDAASGRLDVDGRLGFTVSKADRKCDYPYFPLHEFSRAPQLMVFPRLVKSE